MLSPGGGDWVPECKSEEGRGHAWEGGGLGDHAALLASRSLHGTPPSIPLAGGLQPYPPSTPSARYRDSDIFVKADDDIVFIDVGKFGDFLQGVTYEHVHFPNIVNNDAGLAIQGARNAHPMVAAWVREYERQGVNFTRR